MKYRSFFDNFAYFFCVLFAFNVKLATAIVSSQLQANYNRIGKKQDFKST